MLLNFISDDDDDDDDDGNTCYTFSPLLGTLKPQKN